MLPAWLPPRRSRCDPKVREDPKVSEPRPTAYPAPRQCQGPVPPTPPAALPAAPRGMKRPVVVGSGVGRVGTTTFPQRTPNMPPVQACHRPPPLSGSGGGIKSYSHQVTRTGDPRNLVAPLHSSRMGRVVMTFVTVDLCLCT